MKTDTWAVPSKTKFQVISGFRLQDTRPRVGLIASSPKCCACPRLASHQKRFLLLLVLPPLASYFGFVSFSDSYLTLYAPCLVIKTHSMPFLVGFSHICITRSYAALRAADLDWIVGPRYSLGRVHSGKNHEKPTWNHEKPWKPTTLDAGRGGGRE